MKSNKRALFTVCGICLACLGILLGCWYFGRGDGKDFVAEAENSEATSSWVGTEATSKPVTRTQQCAVKAESSALEEYPKVVERTASEVVIDFTPPAEEAAQEQEVSETEPVREPEPVDEPQQEQPVEPAWTEPEGGGGGGETTYTPPVDGAVEDPVFGKVYPGEAQQQIVDSDGDPEKQVGTM